MHASAPGRKQRQKESSGTQAYDGRDHLPLCFLDHRIRSTFLREPVAAGPGEVGRARRMGEPLPGPQQARGNARTPGRVRGPGSWGHGASPPTCLVRGDVDDCGLAGLGAQVRHTIDSLDPEGVVHVGQQVGHQQAGLNQAGLLGHEAGATPTLLTVTQCPGTAAAHGIVGDVTAATWVERRGPLQGHRCPIHAGDQVHWC